MQSVLQFVTKNKTHKYATFHHINHVVDKSKKVIYIRHFEPTNPKFCGSSNLKSALGTGPGTGAKRFQCLWI